MENNYEEIYDQAGFFAEVWDQLPKEFTENSTPVSPWGTAITSYKMVIWDCSEPKKEYRCLNMDCLSDNVEIEKLVVNNKDAIMVKCKDCGHNLTIYE